MKRPINVCQHVLTEEQQGPLSKKHSPIYILCVQSKGIVNPYEVRLELDALKILTAREK
jgi:hypothetical protein